MIGDQIRELRKSNHLNQEELARLLDKSPSAISMYEKGRREPDSKTLKQICEIFGVTFDYLIGGKEAFESNELNDHIDHMRSVLLKQKGLMFNGMPLSNDDIEKIVDAINIGVTVAAAKRKTQHKD